MKQKKFKVAYSVIADCTESVKADSFEDAVKRVKSGKGNRIDISVNETYDGTDYTVSSGKETRIYYFNADGELVDDSDMPF